jgi:DNA-binding response OmpR family regulator
VGEVQLLKDRVEELEMALGQTEDLRLKLAVRFGLTRIKADLLGMLMERDAITPEGAHVVLYGRRPARSQPDLECVKQHIKQLRDTLSGDDIEIATMWGIGWRLTEKNKRKIRQLLEK